MAYDYDRGCVAASDDPAERIKELKDVLQRARKLRLPDAVAEIQRQLKKAEEAKKG